MLTVCCVVGCSGLRVVLWLVARVHPVLKIKLSCLLLTGQSMIELLTGHVRFIPMRTCSCCAPFEDSVPRALCHSTKILQDCPKS